MKKNYDSLKSAFEECIPKHKYAVVYMMSGLLVCDVSELNDIPYDEVLEARLFDETGEDHICTEDDEVVSYAFSDSDFDADNVRDYKLDICSEKRSAYSHVKIRKYFSFDEDGQAYTVLTRCCGLEG